MQKIKFLACLLTLSLLFSSEAQIAFPDSPKKDFSENLHSEQISDPYRWLENLSSQETMTWVKSQNAFTRDYLHQLPFREKIKAELAKHQDYLRQTPPFKRGKSFYYYKNDGLQDQSVLIELTSFSAPEKLYLDPNTFSEDGSKTLNGVHFSNNGYWVVYGVSEKGSDWKTFKLLDHRSRRPLRDKLQRIKFSGVAWMGNGFFYSAYDEPQGNPISAATGKAKIYFHKIGDEQSADQLVWDKTDASYRISSNQEEDLLFLSGWKGKGNSLAYRFNAGKKITGDWTTLAEGFEHYYSVIGNDENILYLKTNDGAKNGMVVSLDLRKPSRDKWKTVVEENPEKELLRVSRVGEHFICTYMNKGYHEMISYDLKGKLEQVLKLPGLGTVGGIHGNKNSKNAYFSYTSFTQPQSVLKVSLSTLRVSTFYEPEVDFDPRQYEVKQEMVKSKDGTKVPMYLIYKNPIALFGENPTYLFGYGGFGISQMPRYRPEYLPFLNNGGIIALPSLRGGAEMGESWHEGGMLSKKQNVFDDFIASAEHLINNKYTSPEKLAIGGRSNGGLLVGAVMTQAPQLFKAAVPTVGVMDMLRFHKFTVGHHWTNEFGDPDKAEDFKYIKAYSPYHNVVEGTKYPNCLVLTGDNDDRVVPGHSYKFTAKMQGAGAACYLLSYEGKGHRSKTTSQKIEEFTDRWAFIFDQLGMKVE